jgi:ATP/maltotriose-dependent transcriptional regulator MalT
MLLTTKLFVPPIRSAHISRLRLLDKLAEGARARLLLISAPAGFGKTTLVAEWIHHLRQRDTEIREQGEVGSPLPLLSLSSRLAVAWLALDEDDNDPVRFVTYLVAALHSIDERIGRGVQAMLSASPSPDLEMLMTRLVNDMVMVARPFVLVLDDYHLIHQFTGSHHYIIDYLTDEVLQRQPAHVQNFLRQTAILEQLCGPLCDVVTARNDSQTILEQLQRANLFITALDHERRWFRYHHLFADVLRKGEHPGQTQPTQLLHRRAAQWYAKEGLIGDAIRYALAAGDALYAGRLVELYAEQWRHRGEFVTLTKLLDQLPAEIVLTLPTLCLERANSSMFHHQLNEAEEWLNRAEQASGAGPLERTLRGRISAVRLDISLNRSALPAAIHWAEQALADLPVTDQRTRSTVCFCWVLLTCGADNSPRLRRPIKTRCVWASNRALFKSQFTHWRRRPSFGNGGEHGGGRWLLCNGPLIMPWRWACRRRLFWLADTFTWVRFSTS